MEVVEVSADFQKLRPILRVYKAAHTVWNAATCRCFNNRKAICLWLAILLVCLWNSWAVWRVFSLAHVPDELWFYIVALENYRSTDFNPFLSENKFAYGGIWFAIYHFIIGICEIFLPVNYSSLSFHDSSSLLAEGFGYAKIAPLLLMRALSLFSINWIFFLYIRRLYRGGVWAFFSLIFFLSFTMLYWGGKIASPDLLSCVIFFAGVWSFRESRVRAYMLFGAAAGVKLSVIPLLAVFVLFHIVAAVYFYISIRPAGLTINCIRQKIILDLYLGLTLCAAVFVFCNLFSIANTKLYLENLASFSSAFSHENVFSSWVSIFSEVKVRLNNQNGELWDIVNPGGVFYWSSGAPVVALAFFVAFYFSKFKINAAFIFCAFLITLVFLARQPAFGWSWFPLITILPLIFSSVKINRVSVVLLTLLCMASFLSSFPHIRREMALVYQHHKMLKEFLLNKSKLVAEVNHFLSDQNVIERPRILNFIDIGVVYPNAESYNDSYWIYKDKIKEGDLILLGDRVGNYHEWLLQDIQSEFLYSEIRIGNVTAIYLLGKR